MASRNPVLVIALTLLTLGIYGLYWFYMTSKEMMAVSGRDSSPLLWLLGLFIPVVNALILWKYSRLFGELTGKRGVLVFILWLVFFPAAQYVVQKNLNAAAGDAGNPLPP